MDPILEKYIQIIEDYKEGDVSPDGESTLKIYNDGTKVWCDIRGRYHRRGGPAIETVSKRVKFWYINGERHREDGPAVEYPGRKEWWANDKRHREDGPAVEWDNGDRYWYIHDNPLTEDEFYAYHVNKAINIEDDD